VSNQDATGIAANAAACCAETERFVAAIAFARLNTCRCRYRRRGYAYRINVLYVV